MSPAAHKHAPSEAYELEDLDEDWLALLNALDNRLLEVMLLSQATDNDLPQCVFNVSVILVRCTTVLGFLLGFLQAICCHHSAGADKRGLVTAHACRVMLHFDRLIMTPGMHGC